MKSYLWVPMILFFIVGCSQIKEKHITEVSQEELDNIVLIDVRTPREFRDGHLDKAVNIDWLGGSFIEEIDKLDKNETIYLYCKVGGRSGNAAKYMQSKGFKNVYNLAGGYDAYKLNLQKKKL